MSARRRRSRFARAALVAAAALSFVGSVLWGGAVRYARPGPRGQAFAQNFGKRSTNRVVTPKAPGWYSPADVNRAGRA
jgi:4-amino-4-deoxy-L-arabinose transferase-like glycosyltransferase